MMFEMLAFSFNVLMKSHAFIVIKVYHEYLISYYVQCLRNLYLKSAMKDGT